MKLNRMIAIRAEIAIAGVAIMRPATR